MGKVGRDFRAAIGFTSAAKIKDFYRGKDLSRPINYDFVERLNSRLAEMVDVFDIATPASLRPVDSVDFKTLYIHSPYKTMLDAGIIPRMNNLGRNPEDVYFSWMRGYVVANYYKKAIAVLFGLDESLVEVVGDDNLSSIESFAKTPKADLEVPSIDGNPPMRVEMQSGFTGVNQVKAHKVHEARTVWANSGVESIAAHFDFFNGRVALIPLNLIGDDDENWTTSQQMEGQKVLDISDKFFVWELEELPPNWSTIRTEIEID